MTVNGKDFDVRLATDDDVDGILAALSDGYGRPFTREWYDWKHRESPWGPSRCFVAEDEGGLLGTVFAMPWRFVEAGQPVAGWRMVDGATTVRAQRRGVFRGVVAELLETSARAPARGVVLATATPEARLAHIKNGAKTLDPIHAYYCPALWSRGAVVTSDEVLSSWVPPASEAMATAWDTASLMWRLDARGGVGYSASRLAQVSRAHGVVHRTVGRGVRSLVVTARWGEPDDVQRLIRALAFRTKATAVLSNAGEGTTRSKPRVAVARGESLMCVWDQRSISDVRTWVRRGWALDGLDLEGLV